MVDLRIGCLNIYPGFRANGKTVSGPGLHFFEMLKAELEQLGYTPLFYEASKHRKMHFDILVCGCYPKNPEHMKHYKAKVKVFWTAENLIRVGLPLSRVLNHADYLIGYTNSADNSIDRRPNGKTLLRFPCYMFCCPGFMDSDEKLRELISQKNPQEEPGNDDVSFVARNANGGSRMKMVNSLRSHGYSVVCPSKIGRNTGRSVEQITGLSDWRHAKIEYLSRFRYNLCPENTCAPGYTTEKLFHAVLAGAIPIYWGHKETVVNDEIVNAECVAWCPNRHSISKEEINRATEKALSVGFFQAHAVERIAEIRDNFREILQEILDKIGK